MSNRVTEEMISAFIDGELSPEDKSSVEKAISTDDAVRAIYESYLESGSAIQASSVYVASSVALPADFASRVMADIYATQKNESNPSEKGKRDKAKQGEAKQGEARQSEVDPVMDQTPAAATHASPVVGSNGFWSLRTVVEVIAASVAIVAIAIAWQGRTSLPNNVAKPDDAQIETKDRPQNGVRALGDPNGDFKGGGVTSNKSKSSESQKIQSTSREFSVFVDAKSRPQVDRFWIMNDYEVGAPENADPAGDGSAVNVLLIDAKKADALKFFAQLGKLDSDYKVFQQSKAGAASWLAPFDISKAESAEGDFWTLQIVLIEK